jgi:hypothetical protein
MINGKRPLFSWEDARYYAGNRPVANRVASVHRADNLSQWKTPDGAASMERLVREPIWLLTRIYLRRKARRTPHNRQRIVSLAPRNKAQDQNFRFSCTV